MSWLGYLLGGLTLAGVVGVVVYYIRKAVLNVARAEGLQATTELQEKRIRAQEAAEVEDRVKARKDIDARLDSVHTAGDATDLLGDAFGDDPSVN